MMKTILIPTDFSPAATNALMYGFELAKYFNTKIVLVNAYPIPSATYDTGIPLNVINVLQDASEGALNELKVKYPEFKIECFSAMGFAFDVIEKATQKFNADLVVMGIVGEAGPLKRHVIGSTAISVARKLKVPAFIIPEKTSYRRIKKIAFACDFDKTQERILVDGVKYFGRLFGAEIDIINVERSFETAAFEKWSINEFIDKKLNTVNHKITFLKNDDITDGIEEYISEYPVDVLMLNPKTHNVFHVLFAENVTKELAFKVSIPLLLIH